MKKNYILTGILIASFLMLCNIFVNAQSITLPFQSDFSAIGGNSETSGGSGTLVSAANFPVGFLHAESERIYGGGQKLKFGVSDNIGVLTSAVINKGGATLIEVKFDAIAWPQTTTAKTAKIILTYGDQTKEVIAAGKVGWPLLNSELIEYSAQFTAIATPTSLVIKTAGNSSSNESRIFLNNVRIAEYSSNKVVMPTFSPGTGNYITPQDVMIECATGGATIHYTLDDSTPTTGDPIFSATSPIPVSTTKTIKALAVKDGMDPSDIGSATYTFPIPVANIAAFKATTTVTSPTIYKITGDVTFVYRGGPNNRNIYIKDNTGGLMIFDNTNPKVITTEYQNGDIISGGIIGSCTVYNELYELIPSINTAPGTPGTPVSPKVITMSELLANFSEYESQLICLENVTFDEGTFTGSGTGMNINMYQEDDVMTCRNYFGNLTDYTTIPDKPFHVVGFPVPFNAEKQFAPRDEDDIVAADQVVAAPEFSPEGGIYSEPLAVTITCATDGAEIRYTTDGTEPTQTSALFTDPIPVSETTTIKARGFHTGLNPSIIVSATYTFPNPDQVATPTFTPAGGDFSDVVRVTINCATEGAAIYYTINGGTPTEDDILFVDEIEIPEGTTILKAKAFKAGMVPSDVATASYTVVLGIEEWGAQISIYPNPTTGELRITNYELRITNVEVYDVYGRKNVTTVTCHDCHETALNISHLSAGIYFLKITTEKGEIVRKVVKQ
jgi:hypothetical protein